MQEEVDSAIWFIYFIRLTVTSLSKCMYKYICCYCCILSCGKAHTVHSFIYCRHLHSTPSGGTSVQHVSQRKECWPDDKSWISLSRACITATNRWMSVTFCPWPEFDPGLTPSAPLQRDSSCSRCFLDTPAHSLSQSSSAPCSCHYSC